MYGYKDGHFWKVRPRRGRVGRDLLVINIGPRRGHSSLHSCYKHVIPSKL